MKTTQRRITNIVGHDLASSLEPLSLRRSVASLSLFYNTIMEGVSKNFHWLFHLTVPLAAPHVSLFIHILIYCICPKSKYLVVLIQFLPTYTLKTPGSDLTRKRVPWGQTHSWVRLIWNLGKNFRNLSPKCLSDSDSGSV